MDENEEDEKDPEDAVEWASAWANDEGYLDSLQDAADLLDGAYNDIHPGSVLLVNILSLIHI